MFQNRIKILHLADLHLGRRFSTDSIIGDDYSSRREELWRTFEKAINYANSEGVEIILLAGDLYENESMTISNLDRMSYIFKKYNNIEFFIVFGNHDHISDKSQYLKSIVPSNVKIFDNRLEFFEHKNIRVYGFSWDRLEYTSIPFELPVLDDEYFNILLLHCMVGTNNSYLPINPNTFLDIGFDYLALGHIHNPQIVNESTYYSGSIEPMSFNNLSDHGGIMVDIMDKKKKVKFIKFATTKYANKTIDITNLWDNIDLLETTNQALEGLSPNDYIRVNFTGFKDSSIDIEEARLYLNNKYQNIEIIDNTKLNIDLEDIVHGNRDNLIGKYFNYIYENYHGDELSKLIDIGVEVILKEEYLED